MSIQSPVAICISTYNGENYIEEQLNSLLGQTYENITIIIRDDGSTDSTVDIIRKIIDNNSSSKKIILHSDLKGNLGFGASFTEIMKASEGYGDFSYFSFCDQDDKWLPDKIFSAVERIQAEEMIYDSGEYSADKHPVLYTCSYFLGDSNLNYSFAEDISNRLLPSSAFMNQFFESSYLGFTMVFNKSLKKLAFDKVNFKLSSHDKWMSAVALGMGAKIIVDNTPRAIYRRHGSTVSSCNQSLVSKMSWRFNKVLKGDYCHQIKELLWHYKDIFYPELYSTDNGHFLEIFTRNYAFGRVCKILYPRRLRRSISGEIMLRAMIAIGKI